MLHTLNALAAKLSPTQVQNVDGNANRIAAAAAAAAAAATALTTLNGNRYLPTIIILLHATDISRVITHVTADTRFRLFFFVCPTRFYIRFFSFTADARYNN